jgi:hypothetical protein
MLRYSLQKIVLSKLYYYRDGLEGGGGEEKICFKLQELRKKMNSVN